MKAIPSRVQTPQETTMAKLARFGLGRVLLHLIAMSGDRAVRFHCAGIMRELSWLAQARKLPGRVATRLIGALVLYLAKPVKHASRSTTADLQSLSAILRRGDVLLTEGDTRMATLVKRLTGSSWSHVSMYVGPLEEGPNPRCIVEADVAAGVRAVTLSEVSALRVRVLRPTGLQETDRRCLADWVVGRIGDGYDVAHAWALMRRLLPVPMVSRFPAAPSTMAQGATRFICSSLLAQAFVLVGHPIVATHACAASAMDHRYVTPPDFERASGFEVVRAMPVSCFES